LHAEIAQYDGASIHCEVNGMMAKCVGKGYHSGYWKDRFIAVPHWIGFFKQNL
jgi:hypothetical protein